MPEIKLRGKEQGKMKFENTFPVFEKDKGNANSVNQSKYENGLINKIIIYQINKIYFFNSTIIR